MRPQDPSTRGGAARQAVLLALVLVWHAAGASPAAERLTVRVLGVAVSPAGDEIALSTPGRAGATRLGLGDASGFGLELAYEWRPRIALELMALVADYDVDLDPAPGAEGAPVRGVLRSETYTLGLDYRFARAGRAELLVGALGGLSYYDDATLPLPASGRREIFRFDDDLGFGVKLAVDLPLDRGGRWLASGAARIASSILEGEEAGRDLDVDPLILTLGVGYRF